MIARGRKHAIREAKKSLKKHYPNLENIDIQSTHDLSIDVDAISKLKGISVVPMEFSENISGAFLKKGDKLVIGVNRDHSLHRKRFTIAHEIGHYLLHSDDIIHLDIESVSDDTRLETVYRRATNVSSLEEIEANHFAAELLMPEILVNKCIESGINEITDLADRFNVSEEAMRYRLINLGWL